MNVDGSPVSGPRLTGGSTAILAQLAAITNGMQIWISMGLDADTQVVDTDTDDNRASLTVAGIHFNDIDLAHPAGGDGTDDPPVTADAPDRRF